jgi:hypothetical protein
MFHSQARCLPKKGLPEKTLLPRFVPSDLTA